MGGGRPIAEYRCVPAPFVAGQPDTLMQGFVTKQTKSRNWRQRYAILTPRLSLSLSTLQCLAHALTRWRGMGSVDVHRGAVLLHWAHRGPHKGRGAAEQPDGPL